MVKMDIGEGERRGVGNPKGRRGLDVQIPFGVTRYGDRFRCVTRWESWFFDVSKESLGPSPVSIVFVLYRVSEQQSG